MPDILTNQINVIALKKMNIYDAVEEIIKIRKIQIVAVKLSMRLIRY